MAQYGGPSSPPRVHRPRAHIMSAPPPLTAPLAPLRPQPPVSLVAPRPENERATNEYVETPFRTAVKPPTPPPPPRAHHVLHQQQQQRPTRLALSAATPTTLLEPITKQPTASFSKDPTSTTTTSSSNGLVSAGGDCIARQSIVCPVCSRCRCESCQRPRPLPQRWVCNNGCLLSADTIIDYASCLCCVKAVFYHCSESDGGAGESCADDPCGCTPDRRKARWGCLGALSFLLPCLCLYWPLRGCKHVVQVCYANHSRTGCRCRRNNAPVAASAAATPEKRLLDSSPDF